MFPEQNMTNWLSRRNLPEESEPDAEAITYLLITLAKSPGQLPASAVAYLVDRFTRHCVESPQDN